MTLAVATTSQLATDGTRNLESTKTTHNTTTTVPPKYRSRWWISTSRNLGHPSTRDLLKVLKAAHAKSSARTCDANINAQNVTHTKPQPSRKAAVPRTYEFNRIIALDVFYIPLRPVSSDSEHLMSWYEFPGRGSHAARWCGQLFRERGDGTLALQMS